MIVNDFSVIAICVLLLDWNNWIVYLIGYFTFKRLDARSDCDAKGFAGQLSNGPLFLNIAGHSYFILFSCQQSLQTFSICSYATILTF